MSRRSELPGRRFGPASRTSIASPDLAFRATGGRYSRTPTVLELFGDRGFILGSPDLKSEVGWVGDAGAVYAPSSALGTVSQGQGSRTPSDS